jgi:hypothetical protein
MSIQDEIEIIKRLNMPSDIVEFMEKNAVRLDFQVLLQTLLNKEVIEDASKELLCLLFYSCGYLSAINELVERDSDD